MGPLILRSVGKHLEYGGDDAAFMSRYAAELAEALQSAPSDTGGPTTAKDAVAAPHFVHARARAVMRARAPARRGRTHDRYL